MNNAVYGKKCESKRRRMKIELTRDARRTLTIVSKFEFDKIKVFGENMVALSSRPIKTYWDTPTIVGATILYSSEILHVSVSLWNNAIFI